MMTEKNFSDSVILGSIYQTNIENIILRQMQIEDGVRIHTCNDYGNSLEVIKLASQKAGKAPRLLTKVYYKYPHSLHRRFRPIINQLNEISKRLEVHPASWEIQLCCKCNPLNLMTSYGKQFIKIIKDDFNIKSIFFETYPSYKFNYNSIKLLNEFYIDQFSFGLIGFQNLERRVFSNKELTIVKNRNINVGFMGFLGLGKKDIELGKKNNLMYSMTKEEKAKLNSAYLISAMKFGVCSFGITAVSNVDQYKSLKSIYNKLINNEDDCSINKQLIENLIIHNPYFFNDFDQYRVKYKDINPLIKRFAYRIYNLFTHSSLNVRIGNGFI
tara:strand:- start:773 stop:1756 length:984 start_codon:yes stop_codon:yes gene_type:complete